MPAPDDAAGADRNPPPADPFGDAGPVTPGMETYRLAFPPEVPSLADTRLPSVTAVPPREDPELRRLRRGGPSGRWELVSYNTLIFLISVCVMTLELTASRLIAKHIGSSLYTWTSVIGVVLAGITLGNWVGGYLADHFPRRRALGLTLLAASISVAATLVLDRQIAGLERPASFDWPIWILIVVGLLFLVPSLALGTCGTLVSTLALSRSTRLGMAVGNIHAWGAAGSIAGTFLTGFVLIDVLGTRAILCLVAITLACLALVVMAGGWAFRSAVVLGWMQVLFWLSLFATGTRPALATAGEVLGRAYDALPLADGPVLASTRWGVWGGDVGEKLHELGLLMDLRDDRVGEFTDESAYSFINVIDDVEQGNKILRLDQLIHSYYDPRDPTKFVYEYEQIYAAVTKAMTQASAGPGKLVVPTFPHAEAIRDKLTTATLPAGLQFDAATSTLLLERPTAEQLQWLRELSTSADYQSAIEAAYRGSRAADFAGFLAISLAALPEGVEWPAELATTIRYDADLKTLTVYAALTDEQLQRLQRLDPDHPWFAAVEGVVATAQPISALCLGGGGFILPRWVAREYPAARHIDVAELDPAVYRVAISQLGLTDRDRERITTTIGDARNFVDDQRRQNRLRAARGEPELRYDFIYGDAFNDFSIPWHLTTREFMQRLKDLMNPEGVLLANIIEIYPRTLYPAASEGVGTSSFTGELPSRLVGLNLKNGVWTPAGEGYEGFQLTTIGWNSYELRSVGPASRSAEQRLKDADDRSDWKRAVEAAAAKSRELPAFAGTIPAALLASAALPGEWSAAPEPYSFFETYLREDGGRTLAVRGVLSEADREALVAVAPDDAAWKQAVQELGHRSQRIDYGLFLGRYVATAASVFSHVTIYAASGKQPSDDRDTFVMVCSDAPLPRQSVLETGYWEGDYFAALETSSEVGGNSPSSTTRKYVGQMRSVLGLAEGQVLTDDFAPVELLLRPVYIRQHE